MARALPPGSSAGAGAEETRKEGGRLGGRRGGKKGAGVSRGSRGEGQPAVFPRGGVTRASAHPRRPDLYSRDKLAATAAVCTLYPIPYRVKQPE